MVNRVYRCGVCGQTDNDIDRLRSHMISDHVTGTEADQENEKSQNVEQAAEAVSNGNVEMCTEAQGTRCGSVIS